MAAHLEALNDLTSGSVSDARTFVELGGCRIPAGSFQSRRWDVSDPSTAAGLSCSISSSFPPGLQGSKDQQQDKCTDFPQDLSQLTISDQSVREADLQTPAITPTEQQGALLDSYSSTVPSCFCLIWVFIGFMFIQDTNVGLHPNTFVSRL